LVLDLSQMMEITKTRAAESSPVVAVMVSRSSRRKSGKLERYHVVPDADDTLAAMWEKGSTFIPSQGWQSFDMRDHASPQKNGSPSSSTSSSSSDSTKNASWMINRPSMVYVRK
jgi:hypothetical protein